MSAPSLEFMLILFAIWKENIKVNHFISPNDRDLPSTSWKTNEKAQGPALNTDRND